MEIKEIAGGISVFLAILSYGPYIWGIARNKIRPHALSWLTWSVLAAIAFAIQIVNDAGAGAWLMGLTTLATCVIFFLSLKKGEKNILLVDWASLILAGIALGIWLITNNPLLSVLLISVIDLIGGFFPTIRKAFHKPNEETVSLYFIYGLSLVFSLIALKKIDLINTIYPLTFVVVNIFMVTFLLIRRTQIISNPTA